MEKAFSVETEAATGDLFAVVGDLTTYPDWLEVVRAVEPTDQDETWMVTLRGRVGPFSRSKRLRMTRTVFDPNGEVMLARFQRNEVDDKDHSDWIMEATVVESQAAGSTSTATVLLSYGGPMWSGLLDGVLDSVAKKATAKLRSYVKP